MKWWSGYPKPFCYNPQVHAILKALPAHLQQMQEKKDKEKDNDKDKEKDGCEKEKEKENK